MARRVLICDDDEDVRALVARSAAARGDEVVEAEGGDQALALISEETPDLLLLDLHMPDKTGLDVLAILRETPSPPAVIVMTTDHNVDAALRATQLGASAYINKPINFEELWAQAERALERRALEHELSALRKARGYGKLIGSAPAMRPVFETLTRLEKVATPTVLVRGESGTGKDLVAQAIHSQGPRSEEPFLEVDCASLPEQLIESELFGYEKGAFTDARGTKPGLFEVVGEGTLFLDEIGEMPLGTQAKLLRALENRTFKRVGGLRSLDLRAAVIAATNRDLAAEVRAGRFREDLYFRLNVVPLEVPPLRERLEDLPALVEHFLERFNQELGCNFEAPSEACLKALKRYAWPGNVRELRNVLERVAILDPTDGPLQASQLPLDVRFGVATNAPVEGTRDITEGEERRFTLPEGGVDLEWLERDLLVQALERTGDVRKKAAELLGITRHALRYRLQKHGLEKPD